MQRIVAYQRDVARAVSYMPLYDQLELTLELLDRHGDSYLDEEPRKPMPLNVVRFRVRRPR
jgi:hypothetical protein